MLISANREFVKKIMKITHDFWAIMRTHPGHLRKEERITGNRAYILCTMLKIEIEFYWSRIQNKIILLIKNLE
jgi:hypothetical protein